MKVYVESNFVLELALEQEQHASCVRLLELAQSRRIELLVPAYSLVEPHEVLTRRRLERTQIKERIDRELKLLDRSERNQHRLAGFREMTDLLVASTKEEARRLERLRLRMTGDCTVLPLDGGILVDGFGYQLAYGLTPQDSIVLASVLTHLDRSGDGESCFLNRDGDFADPDIIEELHRRRCALVQRFDHGLARVQSLVEDEEQPAGG